MTRQNKELLLKDLCARLPYGVKVHAKYVDTDIDTEVEKVGVLSMVDKDAVIAFTSDDTNYYNYYVAIHEVKPYLIPLSSISEELKNFIRWKLTTPKYDSFDKESLEDLLNSNMQVVHYCYEHHLDINGLIERGLALEAPEGMYN